MPPGFISSVIKYASALSLSTFFAGTASGIYIRWQHHTSDQSFHLLGLVVAFAFLVSIATYLYGYKNFATSFMALWIGIIFSVLSFTPIALEHSTSSLQDFDLTDILILVSVSINCLKVLTERICNCVSYEPLFLTSEEFLLLVGFLGGSSGTQQFSTISMLVVAAGMHLIGFHLKSSLSVFSSICMCILTGLYFFPAVGIKCNPFCMVGFMAWLSFPSLVDLYFSKLSLLESWKCFIIQGKCIHRLQLLFLFAALITNYAFGFQAVLSRDIAFYTVPLFVLFSALWICFHFMFFITSWGFVGKLEECSVVLKNRGDITDNTMSEVLASKGVRHFCLVSQIVTMYTLVSTGLLSTAAWQKHNGWFISSLFIILPLECIMYDILAKLGKSVGGTAIGYALVAPAHRYSPTGDIVVLAENAFQTVNARAMELINIVSRFFANHMIHNYGTDFSTSGISFDYIQNKIKGFFEQRVIPGLHYDTYILYYSGHVLKDGNWALTEDKTLNFNRILEWWKEKNANTGARLILFLDTAHSEAWLQGIWSNEREFVAIQTGKLAVVYDPEMGNNYPLGELTKLWENFNTSDTKPEDYWNKKDMKVKPVYGVSRDWCSFKFHEPTVNDIAQHVEQNFPRFIKPITKVFTHLPCNTNIFCFCDCFMNSCRRLKMKWFPPAVYDTGHGFKLVR